MRSPRLCYLIAWILPALAACGDGTAPSSPAPQLVYLEGALSGGWMVRVAADGSHRTVLYESTDWISEMHVAPDGRILLLADQWRLLPAAGGIAAPFTPPDLPNGASHPLWAPDGGSILWSFFGEHSRALAIAAPGSATAQQVTPDSLDAFLPDWSPDGQYIAFAALNNLRGTYNLYSIRRDGSDVRKLTDDTLNAAVPPAWSHSGNQIAFAAGEIWSMAPDGSGLRHVTTGGAVGEPDGFAGPVYWAPDDRTLMTTSRRDVYLYRIQVANGQQTPLGVFSPGSNPISPDATRIMYLHGNGPDSVFMNRTSVVVAQPDATHGVTVSPDSVTTFSPVWLPAESGMNP